MRNKALLPGRTFCQNFWEDNGVSYVFSSALGKNSKVSHENFGLSFRLRSTTKNGDYLTIIPKESPYNIHQFEIFISKVYKKKSNMFFFRAGVSCTLQN